MGRHAPSNPPPGDATDADDATSASSQRLRAQRREPTSPFSATTTQLGMPPARPNVPDDSTKRFDVPGGPPPIPVPAPTNVPGFGRESTAQMQLAGPGVRVGQPPPPPATAAPAAAARLGDPAPTAPDELIERDTIETEVPDLPPEVLEAYERSLSDAAAAPIDPSDRDTDLDMAPLSSLPPEVLQGTASEEPPVAARISYDDDLDGEADVSVPGVPVGRRRKSGVRLSFTASALGGLVALGAGAGLFLFISAVTAGGAGKELAAAPAPTTASAPRRQAAEPDEGSAPNQASPAQVAAAEPGPADDAAAPDGEPEDAAANGDDDGASVPEVASADAPSTGDVEARATDESAGEEAEDDEDDGSGPRRDEAGSDRLVAEGRRAVRRGDRAEAVALFEQALELDRWNPRAAAGLARVYLSAESYGEAETWVRRAIELRPRRASYQRLRAQILEAMGQTAAAEAARQDAADLAR